MARRNTWDQLERASSIKWYRDKYGIDRADAEALVGMPDDRRDAIISRHEQWRESVGWPAANSPLSRGHLRDLIRGKVREPRLSQQPQFVADFDTLEDLIQHAAVELGATHVSGDGAHTRLYFPRGGNYPYEEAKVWKQAGYWHTEKRRVGVAALPPDAQPIGRAAGRRAAEAGRGHVEDYIAFDRRGRPIGPPFKRYSDARSKAERAGGHVEFVPRHRTAQEVDGLPVVLSTHGTAKSAEAALRKWKRQGYDAWIVHEPETRVTNERWLVVFHEDVERHSWKPSVRGAKARRQR